MRQTRTIYLHICVYIIITKVLKNSSIEFNNFFAYNVLAYNAYNVFTDNDYIC